MQNGMTMQSDPIMCSGQAMQCDSTTQKAVRVSRISVKADRIVCLVEIAPDVPRRTNPAMAHLLVETVPTLPQHACVNSKGTTFGACIDHTALPHVLEHLVIDCQVQNASEKKAYDTGLFIGTSEWIDEVQGKARLELSYRDDLDALRAIQEAVNILNEVCTQSIGRE